MFHIMILSVGRSKNNFVYQIEIEKHWKIEIHFSTISTRKMIMKQKNDMLQLCCHFSFLSKSNFLFQIVVQLHLYYLELQWKYNPHFISLRSIEVFSVFLIPYEISMSHCSIWHEYFFEVRNISFLHSFNYLKS